ncbi:MAG: FMN-binding protein [Oscillospiraceae bacterium]|nr:FMN-binding protein [Oscillospiraceae bacterium]
MKNDFIKPILVLSLICLVISGALAVTNNVTEPVIASASEQREETAKFEIIPDAEGFIDIDAEGLPTTITEAYSTTNNVGYVFIITANGYGGDVRIICGIDNEGRMIRCSALQQSETKGLGSRVAEPSFQDQFIGVDKRLEGVEAISGATISSSAYIGAIRDVFAAYELITGRG